MVLYYDCYDSPIGRLAAVASPEGLAALYFTEDGNPQGVLKKLPAKYAKAELIHEPARLKPALHWLHLYFDGEKPTAADLGMPTARIGTDFQEDVWKALEAIPFGETASYGDLAAKIGKPKGAQAVGAANGANPLPLIRPCHRVIGKSGKLVGYSGGLWRKEFLLGHEGIELALGSES